MIKMDTGSAVLFFIFMFIVCFMIYDSIPSKYANLKKSFGEFANICMVSFELKKSPLHAIIYGGTRTGKTYFVRQNLKLYRDQTSSEELSLYVFRESENMTGTMTETRTGTIVEIRTKSTNQTIDLVLDELLIISGLKSVHGYRVLKMCQRPTQRC